MRSRSSRSAKSIVTLPRLAPICTPTRVSRRRPAAAPAPAGPGGRRRVGGLRPARRSPGGAGGEDVAPHAVADGVLHRAHRPPLVDGLAGQALLQRPVGRAEQRPGVTRRKLAVGEQVLDAGRQAEQAQRVGHRRAALADALGDLVVGQLEVLDQL